ncbi:MAG: M12 family metallo-peptidase [Saprospiraceae bacterium]
MTRLVALVSMVSLFLPQSTWSQDFFHPVLENRQPSETLAPGQSAFQLDTTGLWQWVRQSDHPVLSIPVDSRQKRLFTLTPTHIMSPGLAARYPNIRTFRSELNGQLLACVITPHSIHAYVDNGMETLLMESGEGVAKLGPVSSWMSPGQTFPCTVIDHNNRITTANSADQPLLEQRDPQADPVLRTYRLAIATTGEFSAKYGNSVASVLEEVVAIINNVNAVMERDLSINLQLIDGTDKLFFLNPVTDPFTNGQPDSLLLQAPFAINAAINTNAYDIGHVLGTNAGGVAFLGTVCTAGKANATSSTFGAYSNSLFYLIVAHEMGHQLNATHSFNLCDGENESSETAYEPGSGSTIMSYSGASTCNTNWIASHNEDYYHTASLNQIITYTRQGIGSTCGSTAALSNTAPRITLLDVGFSHIPHSTPFQLTGEGIDDEDQFLTYCWEEYDLGPQSPLGEPKGDAPAFRSFPPDSNGVRILPNLSNLLLGIKSKTEILPDYSRNLKFRLTVRDNHPGAGLVAWQEIGFKVDGNAGPFKVTQPGAATVWSNDRYQLVTWDVAHTDNAQVNCQGVRILLSTDGGRNHDIVLADVTENDGFAYVLIPPGIETKAANIKVEAVHNVFFNITPGQFEIKSDNTPSWSFGIEPNSLSICIPGSEYIDLPTFSSNGYQDPITISWPDNLPEGLLLSAEKSTVNPGDAFLLELRADYQSIYQDTSFMLTLTSGGETRLVPVTVHLSPSDFSSLELMTPSDGTTGVASLPRLTWSAVPDATYYWVEVATNPSFEDPLLNRLSYANFYDVQTPLEDGMVYYWRITPANECRSGNPSPALAFQTKTQTCQDFTNSTPVLGGRMATSRLNIPAGIIPTDINIPRLKVSWQLLGNLTIDLINPQDSAITLVSGICSNLSNLDLGFDDQSQLTLTCPNRNDQKIIRPEDPLAKLNGDPAGGEWQILVTDNGGNSGGSIDLWSLELCYDNVLDPPQLQASDTLEVTPAIQIALNPDLLTVTDGNQGPEELQVRILQLPHRGMLQAGGQKLSLGSTLSLLQFLDGTTTYTYDATEAGLDSVVVSIEDGQGGWIPRAVVYFRSQTGTSVRPMPTMRFTMYPNPANHRIHLQFSESVDQPTFGIMDALGRMLWQTTRSGQGQIWDLDLPDLSNGMYFIWVKTKGLGGIQKIMIQTH